MDLAEELKKTLKGEILNDETTLKNFSQDASLFEIKPKVIAFPEGVSDVKALVKFVNDHPDDQLSITARSAGTDMSGGAINESIIMEMTQYFNKVIEIGEDYAITQPGVFYRDFEKKTLRRGLLLPCYPASRELCTVGGMVSNNSAGEKTLFYGQTERYVEELKMVLTDGNEYTFRPLTKDQLKKKLAKKDFEGQIYKKLHKLIEDNYDLIKRSKPQVSKNTAGYYLWNVWDEKKEVFDILKMLVGSQGTLGMVTQIKFRLIKPKTHSRMVVIFLKDLKPLSQIVNEVLKYKPEAFESYDDYTIKFAMRFLPEVIKVFKPTNLLSLAWQFIPEAWMTLTSGLPKLILMAEFTGDSEEEVAQKCEQANADLAQFKVKTHITNSADESRKYWVIRRESFNLLRRHVHHMRTAPFIDDIVVNPDVLPEFLPKLRHLLNRYKLIYTVAGHVGNGNFHIIPLMDVSKTHNQEIITELGQKVYDLVFEYGGSMTAEHNDGLMRGPYLKQMYGEKMYKLFKEVKEIFDPKHIFNPNKKVDATFEFSNAHRVNHVD